MNLPGAKNLLLKLDQGVLHLTFNRPEARNALSVAMLADIVATFDAIRDSRQVRAVVMRGAGGNFCAGGDIKDMANLRLAQAQASTSGDGDDPAAAYNRKFGAMLRKVNEAPQATIAICEGAVLGGGFGVACVADVAFAHAEASFGLPETGLGVVPAQIAPFVVQRIGLSQARRLAVCGSRFNGEEARRLGIVHDVFRNGNGSDMERLLGEALQQILRCAPNANAVTKEIMLRVGSGELDALLDFGARRFSEAVRSAEGAEGAAAFVEKRLPKWAQ